MNKKGASEVAGTTTEAETPKTPFKDKLKHYTKETPKNNLTEIKARVSKIIFQNKESGYGILVFESDENSSFTGTGNLSTLNPGDEIKLIGKWINHQKYGKQFSIENFEVIYPETKEGITNYLASGLIENIGPLMANRIVKKFGEKTLKILDENPEKLLEVNGIGQERYKNIKNSWDLNRKQRNTFIFLNSLGIGQIFIRRIFEKYGNKTVEKIKENPYRLIEDFDGIGFLKADGIALNTGIEKDSLPRLKAGIIFVLKETASQGNLFLPLPQLVKDSEKLLEVYDGKVYETLKTMIEAKEIIGEEKGIEIKVYLKKNYNAEVKVSQLIKEILLTKESIQFPEDFSIQEIISVIETDTLKIFDKRQKAALNAVIENKVVIITGGPGTGKTTILDAVVRLFHRMGLKTVLGAPTGRASQRLKDATGEDAKTIHRLLEFSYQGGGFLLNEENPIDAEAIIVDEFSMMDINLTYFLLRAIKKDARFVIVGDVDQLPSVGPGNVFRDMITSQKIPTVRLDTIHRRDEKSLINDNANRINKGKMPIEDKNSADFFFFEIDDTYVIQKKVIALMTKDIPNKLGKFYDPKMDIQVLTPMNKGPIGVFELNKKLQMTLNPINENTPGKQRIIRRDFEFREGDKVMQTINNYEKEVFNGDIGIILKIDLDAEKVEVLFNPNNENEGLKAEYTFSELIELKLAYAITIHKSQGSEFPAVILICHKSHFIMLMRNLIYTGFTRGKRIVSLLGDKIALKIALKNNKPHKRFTSLKERLEAEIP